MASLISSATKVGGSTLASRILGFARDLVIARLFGANGATDAFFVAFKIPNFMRRLFAEGAFSMALVPVLHEYRGRGHGQLKRFVDDMAGTLGIVLLLLTAFGLVAAPLLVLLFAPGFAADPDQHEIAAAMLRLTLPYVLFVTLTAFAGAVLNTHERFGAPAFAPVLLNLTLIACAVWVAPSLDRPIMALAWGVLVAGLAQLVFLLPPLFRLGLLPRPRLNLRDPGIRLVLRRMGPAILGVSVGQISLLLDTLLASFLQTGSISWLYYADRLMEFPLGILAVALGTVIVPRLSKHHSSAASEDFSHTLDWGLRWLLLLGLPAGLGLLALSEPLITTLFGSPEFGERDIVMAAHSLMAYSLGIQGLMAVKILVPGFYARHEVRLPVRAALLSLALGLVCSLALMIPLGTVGLALGTSAAATANALILLRALLVAGVYQPRAGWTSLIARVAAASAIMAAVLYSAAGSIGDWIPLDTGERIWSLMRWVLAGAGIYCTLLLLLGLRRRHLAPAS